MDKSAFQKNIWLFGIIELCLAFLLVEPIFTLYIQTKLGLAFSVGIVFGVRSITSALLEIPSGFFSDIISNRLSIQIAILLDLIAMILLLYATALHEFVLYAIIVGIAGAFYSGSFTAYVYEVCTLSNKNEMYAKYQGRMLVVRYTSVSLASITGGYLAMQSLSTPVMWNIVPMAIACICSFFLDNTVHTKGKSLKSHLLTAIQDCYSNKQLHIALLFLTIQVATWGPIYNMYNMYYKEVLLPVYYFGVLASIGFLLRGIGSWVSYRYTNYIGIKGTLYTTTLLPVGMLYTATLFQTQWSAILLVGTQFWLGVYEPIESTIVNREIKSENRVTMLSIMNSIKSLTVFFTMISLGYLVDAHNVFTAYQLFVIPSLVFLFLIPRMQIYK